MLALLAFHPPALHADMGGNFLTLIPLHGQPISIHDEKGGIRGIDEIVPYLKTRKLTLTPDQITIDPINPLRGIIAGPVNIDVTSDCMGYGTHRFGQITLSRSHPFSHEWRIDEVAPATSLDVMRELHSHFGVHASLLAVAALILFLIIHRRHRHPRLARPA